VTRFSPYYEMRFYDADQIEIGLPSLSHFEPNYLHWWSGLRTRGRFFLPPEDVLSQVSFIEVRSIL
jgi:hypothetical protein